MKILVVEDDIEVLTLSCRMIASRLPESVVYAAESAEAALVSFKRYDPDVVVTDVNMPGTTGLEMAQEMKRLKEELKIIVITGYSDREHVSRSMELGVDDYMVKPLDFKKLITALEVCRDEIAHERRRGSLTS